MPINNRAAVTAAAGCLGSPAHCLIPSSLLHTGTGTAVRSHFITLRLQGPPVAFDCVCRAGVEANKSPSPLHTPSASDHRMPVVQQPLHRQLETTFCRAQSSTPKLQAGRQLQKARFLPTSPDMKLATASALQRELSSGQLNLMQPSAQNL